MKIAIIFNRESQAVINIFGMLNQERYCQETIDAIQRSLEAKGHQVRQFEGDKNIIEELEKFMPSVLSGEKPGLVFNLSYGIQGKCRYMHIPGILEMLGIPYVGSGPETHAIALDKVMTKMIMIQKGLPTPKFGVMVHPDTIETGDLRYPLIVKPKDEAVSFGLKIVHNDQELREAVSYVYNYFRTPALVEEYIDGREINIALLGNNPVSALPPLELIFDEGIPIYTFEDKKHLSGRVVKKVCPARLSLVETNRLQQLAIEAFNALGCCDSARVDFRLDQEGNPYILEVNSMASLSLDSSLVFAAKQIGLTYEKLINQLVEVAYVRYFGPIENTYTQNMEKNTHKAFHYIIHRRDQIEDELKFWTDKPSWTEDPVSSSMIIRVLEERLKQIGLENIPRFTNNRSAWTWATKQGYENGSLVVVALDIPGVRSGYPIPFRKEKEWIYGEGIASSRGGLTTLLSALEVIKNVDKLDDKKIGVFLYIDEGRGMRYSGSMLRNAAQLARQAIVMQPGFEGGTVIDQRRGTKKYAVIIESIPVRIGSRKKQLDALSYFLKKEKRLKMIGNKEKGLTVAVHDLNSERYSVLLPHRVKATLSVTYLDRKMADDAELSIYQLFQDNYDGIQAFVEKLEDRPPLIKRMDNVLLKKLEQISKEWQIPFGVEPSLLATAAGEIPEAIPTVCGLGPASRGLYTPNEAINRTELIQKTILLTLALMA